MLGYVQEKLYIIISCLVSDSGNIQARIHDMVVENPHFRSLKDELNEAKLKTFLSDLENYLNNSEYFTFSELSELLSTDLNNILLNKEMCQKIANALFHIHRYTNEYKDLEWT